jgi:nucleoside-diphosphate-sugar epimerase
MSGKNILITGATGFLGKETVRQLYHTTTDKLYLLSRGKGLTPYNLRLGKEMYDIDRINYVEGDLLQDGVFANEKDRSELEENVDEVIHMGASVDFQESKSDVITRINVEGTKNLIGAVKRFKRQIRFDHISTCYVSGNLGYPNRFDETDNADGLGFKNPYEKSKSLSEKEVRAAGIPHIIIRPSIIIGSSNGQYFDDKTIYAFFKALLLIKSSYSASTGEHDMAANIREHCKIEAPIVGSYDTLKNLIPVDFASKMLVDIVNHDGNGGKVYHLVNPHPSKIGEMVKGATNFLNLDGIYFIEDGAAEINNINKYGQFLLRSLEPYKKYTTHSDPVYGLENTIEVVGKDYIERMPKPDTHFFTGLYKKYYEIAYKDKLSKLSK